MQRVILLTDNEYNELKSASPSAIIEATLANYKKQNEALIKQVQNLQEELNTYKLSSAIKQPSITDRGYTYKDFVREYNYISESTKEKGFKATLLEVAQNLRVNTDVIKETLKRAVNDNLIYRATKSNKYIIN